MSILKNYAVIAAIVLGLVGVILATVNLEVAVAVIWIACTSFTTLEMLVGTIYVEKDTWILLEGRLFPGADLIRFLKEKDHCYRDAIEWGDHQLVPRWDVPAKDAQEIGQVSRPFRVKLVDLRTVVYTKAMVTSRPNDMVVLAVHGGGITCMLLEREEKALKATVSTEVGIANVPPFILAQTDSSGTVYVGGGALYESPIPSSSGSTPGGAYPAASRVLPQPHESRTLGTSSTLLGSPPSPRTSASLSRTPSIVSPSPSIPPPVPFPQMTQLSSSSPIPTTVPAHREVYTPATRTLQ